MDRRGLFGALVALVAAPVAAVAKVGAADQKGGLIELRPGTYPIGSPLILPPGVRVRIAQDNVRIAGLIAVQDGARITNPIIRPARVA